MQVARATIQKLTKDVDELKTRYAAALEAEHAKAVHYETLADF
jgi:hypothetical protein